MGIIKVLPKDTIDKIAAGEVVVNAASVIKELVENSIDAYGKNIIVYTKEGGKSLIRVIDDGKGISREDIPLAFKRNATSKIYDDISSIGSLGFRGEALSSICYVSQVSIATKCETEVTGTKCEINFNEISECSDIACNAGTTIEISNLFYNFPARLKHLGTDSSETREIIEITGKIALSHPEISVTLVCDDKNIFSTSGNGDIKACAAAVLGRKKITGLMDISFENQPLYVNGLISSPNFIETKRSERIVILNGRYIHCESISQAVDAVYTEFYGKTGADYLLYISLPYNMIDVNIHPAKTTVRFLNESLIMLLIKQGMRDFLRNNFILKQQQTHKPLRNSFDKPEIQPMVFEDASIYVKEKKAPQMIGADVFETSIHNVAKETFETKIAEEEAEVHAEKNHINKDIFLQLTNMRYIGNAFELYALIECGDEMYAIDTHAAHERVLYEKYLRAYEENDITKQDLLVPVIVELSPAMYNTALKNIDVFSQIGFNIDDFSDNCIAVRSIPFFLSNSDAADRVDQILDEIVSFSNTSKDKKRRNELLIKRACHNAVRGKENLSKQEVFALLKDLYETEMPFTCPHGRPTIGKLSEKYFMKVFERI